MTDNIEFSGKVFKILFHDKETGFAIFEIRQGMKSINAKGTVDILQRGDTVTCQGYMETDKKWGPYLKMTSFKNVPPTNRSDIVNQLMNMAIKGLGQKTCLRIVDLFEEDTFKILDNDPEELYKVPKLTRDVATKIIEEWKLNRSSLIEKNKLVSLGFTPKQAGEILDHYKKEFKIEILMYNPYILINIPTIKIRFSDLDVIALRNGIHKEDNNRINAGCEHTIKNYMRNSGDTLMEYDMFVSESRKLLGLPKEKLENHIKTTLAQMFHIADDKRDNKSYIQLANVYNAESSIGHKISDILKFPSMKLNGWERLLKNSREEKGHFISGFELTDEQHNAIKIAIENNICVINGGPGVGKTTTLDLLLDVLKRSGKKITLCAPTGKAAKRMQESTKMPSKTIHRTLQYGPYGFELNAGNPLETDVIVIDEFSMVDLSLAYHLFEAINHKTKVIIVGDINQLPSIGAGAVLKNIIESNVVPVARITKIQRQAAFSRIIVNSHRVNEGLMPESGNSDDNMKNDFFFIRTKNDQSTLEMIDQIIGNSDKEGRVYSAYRALKGNETTFNAKENCQVLTPIHSTAVGTQNLNALLQENLNPVEDGFDSIEVGDVSFRMNDNVMQKVNDHEQKIYNGDAGYISFILNNKHNKSDTFARVVYKDEDSKDFAITYKPAKLRDELILSYAITIHKSQGSEYPVVIIPIPHGYTPNLDRSLIYTAITRGKHLVIMIGSEKQLMKGIQNVSSRVRKTRLLERIVQAYSSRD